MNNINFNIDNWIALSPGLITQDDWINWSKNDCAWPEELSAVPVDLIKPMMRRRMSSLSKLALQAALQVSAEQSIDYIVFSSRHGELTRTVKLIEDIIKGEDASPMAFSQSVHNTAAGLFTISANRATPVTSLAAVESTLHHALIEAAIYLQAQPSKRVLVVDFDEPLPVQYKKYEEADQKPYQGYAFASILSAGEQYQLSWCKNRSSFSNLFPQSFSVIDFLLQNKSQQIISDQRFMWTWRHS
ncbi:3-oxoacyl-ACP synthase [Psychromonas sp. RZ22]|uniref:beta-ketoacyl synthase chain length factor n=1 Tax=Psychromonas algarum TaxID=2555643 RepID=UPI00106760C8|nr:beta-ketoacyl synthase chain length factor [Psychromonas sp. RZ22]TEW54080.1 3-oxoacyl-ACP synthase [Psychromonas sp. RZ22]